jgi:hypothetical protein
MFLAARLPGESGREEFFDQAGYAANGLRISLPALSKVTL